MYLYERLQEPKKKKNQIMSKDIRSQLHAELAERTRHLQTVAEALKTELFGIDDIIDRVIDSLRAWYVLPQLISRPVIVCLWGLTGTGKTQLVRRLAQHLGFYDRFIEVQMDGFSHGSGYHSRGSISAMLAESGIAEGMPGILVLDEFQRFRTVEGNGSDAKVERYQDVWALLSDGRLPPALSMLGEIESSLAYAEYTQDRDGTEKKKEDKKRKLHLSPWEAREVKRCLKLSETLLQIMAWKPAEVHARLRAFRDTQQSWETDYSKLLVFVSGNLDEMYAETAQRVEDCDTDADIFHELTKKLSVIDVKKALAERFRPEQIARLGNNHVIYPSFNRATYVRLILSICDRYVAEIQESSGVRFVLDASVYEQIYANAVFPAQGTRPLFSSIHAILSATLVNAALWALEQGANGSEPVWLTLDAGVSAITAKYRKARRQFPVTLELNRLKQRSSEDFRALLAVHEAGHGVVYSLLFARAPQEIKINVASFEGGYNSYEQRKAWSRENLRDRICVSLAGRAAEQLVFGEQACTTGATQDFMQATAQAAQYVRHFAFGSRLSRTDVANDPNDNVNTDIAATNPEIEALLEQEHARALALLDAHTPALMAVVDALLRHGSIAPSELAGMLGLPDPASGAGGAATDAYAALLASFRADRVGLPPPSPPGGGGGAIPASAARVLRAIA
ncbi:ATPase family associated with various cellular activities (AAA) [Variovorax sp. NFACC28]|nr:ATPase family associated with various cellular activities (AAA) [Variovorax sp. NFACC28]SEG71167.1 ATPase family associated with various cellular activities (AAA) [Variovorax sp. NFACC29]SFC80902.1 ATPase family associated with various cellular activities (AAA) [Variovorax sp. NFACC26]SFF99060.1 ATPase family associated with various cellular activities (AAA) [Variovorax sp. NFACC27]